ncbi:helix-turn-helix domain-containing protein [Streptomyces sp. NPDC017941]|uniref:helix-turn-helix domain-containing protein n=1 Tax=Streptomyces sp. NPDC017941 TaxID=3365018 RepID=UPI0037B0A7A1
MPENTDTLRGRLRRARKVAGLSQRELATAADLSISLVQKIEQGERTDIRLETAHALARPLNITTSHLVSGESSVWHSPVSTTTWRAVVAALETPPTQLPEVPTIDGVKGSLAGGRALFATEKYDDLGRLLPALLRDTSALDDAAETRRLRYQVMSLCVSYLGQVRQYKAAADAAQRAMDTSTDDLDGGAAVVARCQQLLRQGQLDVVANLATQWSDDVEPRRISRARPEELAVWGGLQLRVGAASVRDNRKSEAKEALRMAQVAAVALGREVISGPDHLRHFGPATVTQQRAEHAAIQRRPDRVLRLHKAVRQWTPATGGGRSGRYRHLLDVADAHLRLRDEAECVAALQGIREAAPEWLGAQRYAHDIVGRVVERRRTLTPEMRGLADCIGLHV